MTGVHPKIRYDSRFWPWFKDCIGAVYGTYIQGEIPRTKQQGCHKCKGNTSKNILRACDFDTRFTNAHDRKVLENAILDPLEKFYFHHKNIKGFLAPYKGTLYHLHGYRGSGRNPKNDKEPFNYRNAFLCIERTFGAWKSRFRILRQGMNNYDFSTHVKIVVACAVLHNFLCEHQSGDGIFTEYEHDDMDVDETEQQLTQSTNTASSSWSSDREMHARREEIVRVM